MRDVPGPFRLPAPIAAQVPPPHGVPLVPLILEGIVTTRSADGAINVAPMGPIVDAAIQRLMLRPFRTSTTYANLVRTRCGVLHVTDDVLLIAQAAIGALPSPPATFAAQRIEGVVLAEACRWYEFRVAAIDESAERVMMQADVVHAGRLRDFFGFNRARHAVLEAAILATRLHLLPAADVRARLDLLREPVQKTAGPRELQAFALLERHIADFHTAGLPADPPHRPTSAMR